MIDLRQEALVNWLSTERVDGWINELTGAGTSRDKTVFMTPGGFYDLSDWTLEMLFAGDWLAPRIVTALPKDALRKRPKIELGDEKIEKRLRDAFRKLSVFRNVYQAFCWARLYGECAIIPLTPDGSQASTPLNMQSVKTIEKLEVLDRRYYAPFTFYTKGPKAGEPELYSIGSVTPNVRPYYVIHESRMIRIGGALTTQTERLRRNWRDHSILQAPYEAMRSFASGFKSLEVLLTDGPQGVYKIKGLAQVLASPNADLFKKKMVALDTMRSVLRAICIDAEEDFDRGAIQFTGLPDSLDRLTEWMAAAVPMPVTKLMGKSPAGQNATGDSDWENWNGQVSEFQDQELEPVLRTITELLLVTFGVKPSDSLEEPGLTKERTGTQEPLPRKDALEDEAEEGDPEEEEEGEESKAKPAQKPKADPNDFKIEFPPMRELKPGEQADLRLKTAQTDKVYWDMGMSAEQIFKMRFTEQGWSDSYVPSAEDVEQWDASLEAERAGANVPANNELVTPTANETVVTVDEARAALGLPPDADPEIGKLKLTEYRAKQEASGAEVGSAEGVAETEEKGIAKPPEPSPFGAPPEVDEEGNPVAPKPGELQDPEDGPPGKPAFPPKPSGKVGPGKKPPPFKR